MSQLAQIVIALLEFAIKEEPLIAEAIRAWANGSQMPDTPISPEVSRVLGGNKLDGHG